LTFIVSVMTRIDHWYKVESHLTVFPDLKAIAMPTQLRTRVLMHC